MERLKKAVKEAQNVLEVTTSKEFVASLAKQLKGKQTRDAIGNVKVSFTDFEKVAKKLGAKRQSGVKWGMDDGAGDGPGYFMQISIAGDDIEFAYHPKNKEITVL